MGRYAILKKDAQVVPAALEAFVAWYERNSEMRIVGQDNVAGTMVSTVFLGIDHQFGDGPPLWFETMVFPGWLGNMSESDCERYSTMEEARAGHAAMVAKVKGGLRG